MNFAECKDINNDQRCNKPCMEEVEIPALTWILTAIHEKMNIRLVLKPFSKFSFIVQQRLNYISSEQKKPES